MKQKKPLPAFARPVRLPPLVRKGKPASAEDVEAFVRTLSTVTEAPDADYTDDSLAHVGRALALGWLSHGAEPKHAWAARAAGYFPDDATARDLGMYAREIGPRVGQFSKAQILVDVLALMNTRAALEALNMLATKVKTKSVKDRAKSAFDVAAKHLGTSAHDLADKLIPDDAPVGKDFVKRLEQRMIEATTMPALELVENILQRDAVRKRATGVVFTAHVRGHATPFTIVDDRLIDVDGEDYELPPSAQVGVAHPFDLSIAKWSKLVRGAPFQQLDRPIKRFSSLRAMKKHADALVRRTTSRGAIYGLESLGWVRGPIQYGGTFQSIHRELDGMTVTVEFDPIYAGGGGGMAPRIRRIEIEGKGTVRAMAELAHDLDYLVR